MGIAVQRHDESQLRGAKQVPAPDLFALAARQIAPATFRKQRADPSRPLASVMRLAASGIVGGAVSAVLGMPILPSSATQLAGIPLPAGSLFVAGMIALPALRSHRALQQCLRTVVCTILFAYGTPLVLAQYPPGVRVLLSLGMSGTVIALYEWTVPR
jgi:hypothetical protein